MALQVRGKGSHSGPPLFVASVCICVRSGHVHVHVHALYIYNHYYYLRNCLDACVSAGLWVQVPVHHYKRSHHSA